MATMVRPLSNYLVLPLGVGFLAWMIVSKVKWKAILLRLLFFVIPFLLIVGGWQARNYLLTGDASLSQIEAYNLLAYRAADIIALRDGVSIESARQSLGVNHPEIRTSHQEIIRFDHYKERGLQIIQQYLRPVPAVRLIVAFSG